MYHTGEDLSLHGEQALRGAQDTVGFTPHICKGNHVEGCPVSPTMDSPTWLRWWFAAHPNRALRLPAWEEVEPGELLSIFQRAHVIHAVDALLYTWSRVRLLSYEVW
jgi:hypothetical protein